MSDQKIYIFCLGFKKEKDIEAVKKEALTYYKYYKYTKLYDNFKFISLEHDVKDNVEVYDSELDVFYWSYNFNNLLKEQQPNIIHVFSDSLDSYYLFQKNYQEKIFITYITITGINGLPQYENNYLEYLRHAIDVGNLFLFVESAVVKKEFEENGLRTTLMLPKVNLDLSLFSPQPHDVLTLGFASAPLSVELWEDRGVFLLLLLAKQLSDFRFKLAWRYEGYEEIVNLIKEMNLNNVEVLNGYLNMYEFYSDIDVMIAPFKVANNNHSSPLSIVEASVLGIPVLVTEKVGISDIIRNNQLGVVASCDVDNMADSIHRLFSDYDLYKNNVKEKSSELFSILNNDVNYLHYYKLSKFQASSPDLLEWRKQLDNNNSGLVMKRESMANYYNDTFIAENYDEYRFSSYPMRTYDKLERKSIRILVEKYKFSEYSNGNSLIDIASGDGRVLRDLTSYGSVTAVENSAYMISVSAKKLNSKDKVTYVKSDFFDFNTKETFDVVTMFRFMRHFDYLDRKIIYSKIHELIKDGIVIADFPDKRSETQLRESLGWSAFNIYDVFWNELEIVQELNDNGFEILEMIPVGELLMSKDQIKNNYLPLSFTVCFKKRRTI
ncbi:glycosyltransferase [Paenibacillus sp. GM1FR]|uniref:glycosyltransferase n=1 Tax=Paenibacillus sp. GM1FR TaxID=2059267 RepID=UPI0013FE154A|nr:glycosyltransferase [Paenibacillus sp. GM1FR]